MTAKQKREMRRMEIRIEELERHFAIANNFGTENFVSVFNSRVAMRQAYEALLDASDILAAHMRDDPAFMEQFGKRATEVKEW